MSGKICCRCLRANVAAGPPTVTMRSGGAVGERGADIVDDGLFRCDDKSCRTDGDLDDVHCRPRAFLEIDAEIGGEGVERQVAAVERLQHQDLPHRRLSFARRRTEQQPDRQRRTLESATNARHLRARHDSA